MAINTKSTSTSQNHLFGLIDYRAITTIQTSQYTVEDYDYIVLMDPGSGGTSVDLTKLESASHNGRIIIIKDATGSSGTNNITFTTNGTIENGMVVNVAYQALILVWDYANTTWRPISWR